MPEVFRQDQQMGLKGVRSGCRLSGECRTPRGDWSRRSDRRTNPAKETCQMATPGQPFDTEVLDEQRSRQRRLLAGIPDSIIFATATAHSTSVDGDASVESALRGHVDHLAAMHEVTVTLERYGEIRALEILRQVSFDLSCKADDVMHPLVTPRSFSPLTARRCRWTIRRGATYLPGCSTSRRPIGTRRIATATPGSWSGISRLPLAPRSDLVGRSTRLGDCSGNRGDRGLHFTFISTVERGEQNLSLASPLAIADGLDVDPSEFVKGLRRSGGAETE